MIRLRPSAAAIWAGAGCTAYPSLSAKFYERDTDNTAAETGTAAHWVAEQVIATMGGDVADYLGKPAPNGVTVTEEMAEAVDVYTTYVDGLRGVWHIEEGVDVFKGCSGTPDLWTYDATEDILHVVDYKHGMRLVDPVDNWQLSLYAAGIIKGGVTASKVRLTVVQPRAYSSDGSIRHWDTTPEKVEQMRITATTRAVEAQSNPVARSSSQCRYCPARHACPAAVTAGVQLYEAATEPMPYDLEPSEMGVQYEILKRAKEQIGYLLDAYESKIKSTLYSGGKVPGYELEEKHGRAEWTVGDKEIKELGELMGVDLCPPTPITPSKAIKKGVDKGVINAYTERHSKGHDLKTVNLTKAKRIFS